MHRRSALHFLGLAPVGFISPSRISGQGLVSDLSDRWKRSKDYTLAVLEAMPEEHLEYSPTQNQLTFAQHFIHLGFFNNFFLGFMTDPVGFTAFERVFQADYLIRRPDDIELFSPAYLTKRAGEPAKTRVQEYVAGTFDFAIHTLSGLEDAALGEGNEKAKPGFLEGHSNLDLILRGEVHTAHHRAQAVVYLRLKEITPPGFGI